MDPVHAVGSGDKILPSEILFQAIFLGWVRNNTGRPLSGKAGTFDQDKRQENHHIMNVKETDFPEKFRPIIRRLQAAAEEKEVRDTMTIEDDFIAELNDYEHRIAAAVRKQEEERKLKDEERSLKEEALRKQEEAIRKQEEAIRKQEEAIRKQEEAIRKQEEAIRKQEEAIRKQEEERTQKEEAVRLLLSMGMPAGAIAQKLGLPIETVAALEKPEQG